VEPAAEEIAATSEGEASATEATVTPEAEVAPLTVTVQPGFTLWRIATENLGDGIRYVQVFEANKEQIRDPDLIYPGQVFTIPKAE
jgi:nucleoid-associated protein YgaU